MADVIDLQAARIKTIEVRAIDVVGMPGPCWAIVFLDKDGREIEVIAFPGESRDQVLARFPDKP